MKRNNKGFTLIEVIIAITIFTTVIGLGYKVINSTNVVTKNQLKVFTEQQAANLVNKYITSDLERVKSFKDADTSSNPYEYTITSVIDGNVKDIKYEVFIDTENSTYTVTRKLEGSSIEIISNQPTDGSEPPFLIERKEGFTNKYEVKLNGQTKTDDIKKYVFEVSSRIVGNIGSSNIGGSDTTEDDDTTQDDDTQISKYIDGQVRIEQTKGNECSIGVYLFEYKAEDNSDYETIKLDFKDEIKTNQMDKMDITLTIPIQKTDEIILEVKINGTEVVHKETYTKSQLSKQLINDRIEIYCQDRSMISSLMIGSQTIKDYNGWNGNKYSYEVKENNNTIILNCTLNKSINKWSPFVVNFGKYNTYNVR